VVASNDPRGESCGDSHRLPVAARSRLVASAAGDPAARIADIPDQYVAAEMLRAVYAKLNIKL